MATAFERRPERRYVKEAERLGEHSVETKPSSSGGFVRLRNKLASTSDPPCPSSLYLKVSSRSPLERIKGHRVPSALHGGSDRYAGTLLRPDCNQ